MSRQSQCEAVLNRLKQGPATTFQLGYGLNICCVTKRLSELRRAGHVITKSEQRLAGKRVVTYTLCHSDGHPVPASCVPVRSRGRLTLTCDECGDLFDTPHKRSRFCTTSCRTLNWKRNHPRTGSLFEQTA